MRSAARDLRLVLRLALADLRRDGLLSACSVLMLAASLAPLLTLFGLENGVIGTIVARQDKDPAMRLIVPEVGGGHHFDHDWFARVARWPEVAFVLPSTRAIAGLVDLVAWSGTAATGEPVRVSLLPSAEGDPVTADQPGLSGDDRIALTASAARKLGAGPGSRLQLLVERVRDGRSEPASTLLEVAAVLPVERYGGDAAFARLRLVESVQAYRDGHAVPMLAWRGDEPAPAASDYPLFRLYARSIRDVAVLAGRLQAEGISVFTRDSEIAATLGLQRNLLAVLLIVSLLAALGFMVAMIALQIATVRRKRREFAILQLIGYGRPWLAALPCAEAALLALAGIAVAFMLYLAAGWSIDLHFARYLTAGESACRLSPCQASLLACLALLASLLPSVMAGLAAASIDPGDQLREA